MNYEIYKECSLYKNFIYQRYVSELADFSFKPFINDNSSYLDSFIVINKEDELWWQDSTISSEGTASGDVTVGTESVTKNITVQ